jgi:RES domain-containing protein
MAATPFHGMVYRAAEPDQTDLGKTAVRSCADPGRFNTHDVGAIYTCLDPQTALREVQQSSKTKMPDPCAMFTIDAHISRMLDLCDPGERAVWGLSELDLQRDDPSACQAVVARAVTEHIEAVRWPSATGSGESIAIYLAHLQPGSRCTVVDSRVIDPVSSPGAPA